MNKCIFCLRPETENASFSSEEHIIPESLGNKEYILKPGFVCDECNNSFSRLENDFQNKYIGGIEKVLMCIETKKGKYTNLQSNKTTITRIDEKTIEIKYPGEGKLGEKIELEPASFKNVSMVFSKIGLEMICFQSGNKVYKPIYDDLRNYVLSKDRAPKFIPFLYAITPGNNCISLELRKSKFEINYSIIAGTIPGIFFISPISQLTNIDRLRIWQEKKIKQDIDPILVEKDGIKPNTFYLQPHQ